MQIIEISIDCGCDQWRTWADTPANVCSEMFSSDTPSIGNSVQSDRDTLANNR